MQVWRTKYGLVTHRATVGGKPVAYTSLRSTYRHEADSIIGFQMLNDPDVRHGRRRPSSRPPSNIGYAFNWFYVNSAHAAYFNSGDEPGARRRRRPGPARLGASRRTSGGAATRPTNTATYTPAPPAPQSIDQDYYVTWNNKQAKDYTAAAFGNGSVHRGDLLDDRVKTAGRGGRGHPGLADPGHGRGGASPTCAASTLLPELLQVLRHSRSPTPRPPRRSPS